MRLSERTPHSKAVLCTFFQGIKKILEGIKTIVFISVVVLIGLLLHDLFTFDNISKNLFFPKLFENGCFYQAFKRDITDEVGGIMKS